MAEIIAGDNGTVMETTISDNNGIVDIRGASVEFTIKTPTRRFVKQGQIVDGLNGVASFTLNSEDTQEASVYIFQATVIFPDNKLFSSDLKRFTVGAKI